MEDPTLEQVTIGPKKNPSGAHGCPITNGARTSTAGRVPMVSDP